MNAPVLCSDGSRDFLINKEMITNKWQNVISSVCYLSPSCQLHQKQQRTTQSLRKVGQSTCGATIGLDCLLIGQTGLAGNLGRPHQTVAQNDSLKKLPVQPTQITEAMVNIYKAQLDSRRTNLQSSQSFTARLVPLPSKPIDL